MAKRPRTEGYDENDDKSSSSSSVVCSNAVLPDITRKSTEKDVQSWLCQKGFGEYVEEFSKNAIDGEAFGMLTKEQLVQLGVKKIGHLNKLCWFITTWQKSLNPGLGQNRKMQLPADVCGLVKNFKPKPLEYVDLNVHIDRHEVVCKLIDSQQRMVSVTKNGQILVVDKPISSGSSSLVDLLSLFVKNTQKIKIYFGTECFFEDSPLHRLNKKDFVDVAEVLELAVKLFLSQTLFKMPEPN